MNTSSRTMIASAATALLTMAASTTALAASGADHAASTRAGAGRSTWGPYSSPGTKRAKAKGTITATGEDHEVIPSAATLTVSGTVSDLSRSSSTCGWAVFEIATVNAAGSKVIWKRHSVRTCAYHTPKAFSFSYHRVFKVDMKVCAEGRGAEPSIQCTAGNPAWTDIYVSPH